jgi:hypothetical protein
MSGKRSYLAAAFNARTFGMPIPLNWFGIAAFGLLGAFVNPAFFIIGAGLEGLYLWGLTRSSRFRATVDAENGRDTWDSRYTTLVQALDDDARRSQAAIELQAGEIVGLLTRIGSTQSQVDDVRQMAWLHLKLLAARAAFQRVIADAKSERKQLDEQEERVRARIGRGDADEELKRSLEQQLSVITSRRVAHADADKRSELVEAELDRLRQQVSLVKEQALLATDERTAAQSLDALSASLNEANRWLKDQRELFSGLDTLADEPPPPEMLLPKATRATPTARRDKVAQ